MSFYLSGVVEKFVIRGLTATEKLILYMYAGYAEDDGSHIRPCQATIARKSMCSERMVRKALDKFATAGVMMPVGKKGRCKDYKIFLEKVIEHYCDADEIAEHSSGMGKRKAEHSSGSSPGRDTGIAEPGSKIAAHGSGIGSGKAEPGSKIAEPGAKTPAHSSGNPIKSPSENPTPRAGAADGAAAARARWADRRQALVDEIGEGEFGSWIKQLGPLSDDGKVMRIACPSVFIRTYVAEHYLTSMSSILEREVVLVNCMAARGEAAE